jgi:hypothetical protein
VSTSIRTMRSDLMPSTARMKQLCKPFGHWLLVRHRRMRNSSAGSQIWIVLFQVPLGIAIESSHGQPHVEGIRLRLERCTFGRSLLMFSFRVSLVINSIPV